MRFLRNLLFTTVFCIGTTVFAQQPVEKRYSPHETVVLATADAAAVATLNDDSIDPEMVVYISLHNKPLEERIKYKAAVDMVLNSLNLRYRNIIRTAAIPNDKNPVIVRVNLRDYNLSKKQWNRLVSVGSGPTPQSEAYYYQRVVKTVDEYKEEKYTETEKKIVGYYNGDKNRPAYEEKQVEKTKQVKVASKNENILITSPYLALEKENAGSTIATLMKITQNKYPMVRADWFVTYATWAPMYYELIGLELKDNPDKEDKKNPKVFLEKDFANLFGFDFDKSKEDMLAAITDTKIVTLHNRIIHRFTTTRGLPYGTYWRSIDTDTGLDDEDYLENVTNFDNPKSKATEIIASGRNGLHAYALANNKGVVLNLAVASIAVHGDDMPTKFKDKQVYAGRNCMLCHASGQIYLQDKVRNIAQDKIALLIKDKTKDKEIELKIREAFTPDTKTIIDIDNAKFTAAVKAATGMEAKEVGKLIETIINEYYYEPITLDKMAWEVGWESDKLLAALQKAAGVHYSITAILQNPPEKVYRQSWEKRGYSSLVEVLLKSQEQK